MLGLFYIWTIKDWHLINKFYDNQTKIQIYAMHQCYAPMNGRTEEWENWRTGGLENERTGELENGRTGELENGELENWNMGELENWKMRELENWKMGNHQRYAPTLLTNATHQCNAPTLCIKATHQHYAPTLLTNAIEILIPSQQPQENAKATRHPQMERSSICIFLSQWHNNIEMETGDRRKPDEIKNLLQLLGSPGAAGTSA